MATTLGTITFVDQQGAEPSSPGFHDLISFPGDSSYTTGGTVGFKAIFNAKSKDSRQPLAVVSQNLTHELKYDYANDKLIAIVRTTGLEVGNGVDLSATVFKALVISK